MERRKRPRRWGGREESGRCCGTTALDTRTRLYTVGGGGLRPIGVIGQALCCRRRMALLSYFQDKATTDGSQKRVYKKAYP